MSKIRLQEQELEATFGLHSTPGPFSAHPDEPGRSDSFEVPQLWIESCLQFCLGLHRSFYSKLSVSPYGLPSSLLSLSFCKHVRALSDIHTTIWASVEAALNLDIGVQCDCRVVASSSSMPRGSPLGLIPPPTHSHLLVPSFHPKQDKGYVIPCTQNSRPILPYGGRVHHMA